MIVAVHSHRAALAIFTLIASEQGALHMKLSPHGAVQMHTERSAAVVCEVVVELGVLDHVVLPLRPLLDAYGPAQTVGKVLDEAALLGLGFGLRG